MPRKNGFASLILIFVAVIFNGSDVESCVCAAYQGKLVVPICHSFAAIS
jgi:hypothetical protein